MKKLLVLGAGESGTGAALLGQKLGYDVFISDSGKVADKYQNVLNKSGIKWEEGGHSDAFLANPDLVIKSPGIPGTIDLIKNLKAQGVEIISEIEFGARNSSSNIIAITGTNGKTTTTMLTYHILKNAGLDVGIAGNVGNSFCGELLEGDREYFVLEVSSFQLDDAYQFKPFISVITNITPDHLDRYGYEMSRYVDAKFRIAQAQDESDHFIYSADNEILVSEIERRGLKPQLHPISITRPVENGAELIDNKLIIKITDKPLFEMSIHDLALLGKHNTKNSMAAGVAARILEIRKEVVRDSLADFQNVEHRLEFVATIHGIQFINDSKATNVNSTWYALESMRDPVVWIVGGVDKGNDYSMLFDLVADKVKAIICLGTDNKKLLETFSERVENIAEAGSAREAVGLGYQFAEKGDAVLLSPCCASFDLFDNYEDRGQQFKHAVKML
ncbi:MAG: UDP-N-acetylmuramoyl-L-alanine--D-glutamate ligase [Bacteroidota bacterium]